jgi:hypothetical protein
VASIDAFIEQQLLSLQILEPLAVGGSTAMLKLDEVFRDSLHEAWAETSSK